MARTSHKRSSRSAGITLDEEFADLVIDCQGIKFKVHRAVVCSVDGSGMLRAALKDSWKVISAPMMLLVDRADSSTQESKTGLITFPEEDPKTISKMVEFMYSGDYDDKEEGRLITSPKKLRLALSASESDDELSLSDEEDVVLDQNRVDRLLESMKVHLFVYKCADMLGIKKLTNVASDRFCKKATRVVGEQGFDKILALVFEKTTTEDGKMRLRVLELCVQNYEAIESKPATLAVLLNNENNAWKVAVSVLKRANGEGFIDRLQKVADTSNVGTCCECRRRWTANGVQLIVTDETLGMLCRGCTRMAGSRYR